MSLFNFDHRNTKLALAGGLLVIAAGAFGGGCSGGGYASEAEFCQAAAEVECNQSVVTTCYGSTSDAQLQQDTASCISGRSQTNHCNPARLPYHPEVSSDCVDALGQLWATGNFDLSAKKNADSICAGVFNRGRAEGLSCEADTDCDVANGLHCLGQAGSRATCRIPKPVMPGETCGNDPSSQCVDSQGVPGSHYCDAGGHCVTNQSVDQACGANQPCGDGLRCDDAKRICKKQASNGSDCTLDNECSGGFCLSAGGTGSDGLCSGQFRLDFSTTCSGFRVGSR